MEWLLITLQTEYFFVVKELDWRGQKIKTLDAQSFDPNTLNKLKTGTLITKQKRDLDKILVEFPEFITGKIGFTTVKTQNCM